MADKNVNYYKFFGNQPFKILLKFHMHTYTHTQTHTQNSHSQNSISQKDKPPYERIFIIAFLLVAKKNNKKLETQRIPINDEMGNYVLVDFFL